MTEHVSGNLPSLQCVGDAQTKDGRVFFFKCRCGRWSGWAHVFAIHWRNGVSRHDFNHKVLRGTMQEALMQVCDEGPDDRLRGMRGSYDPLEIYFSRPALARVYPEAPDQVMNCLPVNGRPVDSLFGQQTTRSNALFSDEIKRYMGECLTWATYALIAQLSDPGCVPDTN